jgi:alpha-galactosidase
LTGGCGFVFIAGIAMKFSSPCLLLFLTTLVASARIESPDTNLTAREQLIVTAARDDHELRFNGAKTLGVWPGTPVIFSVSVSGARPVEFSARHLPDGLSLDPRTGIITGSLHKPGKFSFTVTAKNSTGKASAKFQIVCGNTLALTPPMGWNSYDAFGDAVVESEVLSNAMWMKEHLQPFGWDTVVVDFRWYDRLADGIRVQNPEGDTLDEFGRMIPPTNRFPSAANGEGFKALADKIHAMGLKFGIHIMRGIPRRAVEEDLPIHGTNFRASQAVRPLGDPARECRWNRDMFGVDASTAAGKAWYADIAKQYAGWGVDYIKCDDIANLQHGTNRYPRLEVEALANGLRASGRSIVLSLSPGPALISESAHLKQYANLWRISSDFWDNWRSLNRNFDLFARWQTKGSIGHWPDGDMIPFGHIAIRNCDVHPERWTRFTRDEQLTLMSLWSLAPSPLMLGMNLPDNDDWTTALLTNPEVLAVNQDKLGERGWRVSAAGQTPEIWARRLAGGSLAVGFFNRTDGAMKVNYAWSKLGFAAAVQPPGPWHGATLLMRRPSAPEVRDLWLRKDLDRQKSFVAELPPHGCVLLKVR